MEAESTLTPSRDEAAAKSGEMEVKTAAKESSKPRSPHFKLVEEFFRVLLVAEKNFALYPVFGKVVQESLDTSFKVTEQVLDTVGPLRLVISQRDIRFEDDPIYEEENKAKSVAFRLYKDGIRELIFFPGSERDELESLLSCLKEARNLEDEDDDFITLFWEKDCDSIKVHMADDFIAADELPELPTGDGSTITFHEERFSIPASEKNRLTELLQARRSEEDEGESTFEISDEDVVEIQKSVGEEEAYFPLFDFLDIIVELMVRKPDAESLEKSVQMVRSVIDSLIQNRDFTHAGKLLARFASEAHSSLSERQVRALHEMAASFNDTKTLHIIKEFLEENQRLPTDSGVFELMKAFPKSAAEDFCQFLTIGNHMKPISKVLVHLGTGKAEVFTRMLSDPDPLIVRAMIEILLQTDNEKATARIARALKHPDESVRLHAANTMLEHGDADSGQFFIPLLGESSRQLLNIALQFFTRHMVPDAFEHLLSLSGSKRFHVLDQKRQEITFKAILKASPTQGVEYLKTKVLRWAFCINQNSRMKKTAAINALAFTNTEEALALLARFAMRKRGPLPAAARRAMKRWEHLSTSDEASPCGR
jgi:HEAT repeat protein